MGVVEMRIDEENNFIREREENLCELKKDLGL